MKRKINIQILGIAAAAIILTLIMLTAVFYELFQKEILNDLKIHAHLLKYNEGFNELKPDYNVKLNDLKITLIDVDGMVKYDTSAEILDKDNHESTVEIEEAFVNGEGKSVRRSNTLDKNNFYYAVLLNNGSVLRVSKESDSIWGIFKSAFPIIGGIEALLFIICVILAHFLTKSLLTPIEQIAIDMDHLESISIYKELVPFVTTIQKQHEDILKSSKIRQEFTANVSHELKTPLTSISGYSELIESGMATDEDVIRFAGEIHQNSNRLLILINEIIRLSELDVTEQKVQFEKVDLYEVAENCVNMLQVNSENHEVNLFLKGSSCIIQANKEMMEELLYNLCDNAIRYNNKGGSVKVLVEHVEDNVVLSVKDTGIGILKEHQERIFERFYRVDKSRSKSTGGTGLGLAIVKHIVAKHNAKMEIQSEKGVGTEVKVTFYK